MTDLDSGFDANEPGIFNPITIDEAKKVGTSLAPRTQQLSYLSKIKR